MDKSEWTGRVGDVWAEEWRRTDRSFVPVDQRLVETAIARIAGREDPDVLDIGCGAGTTTLNIARRLPRYQMQWRDRPARTVSIRARDAAHFEGADR